MSEKRNVSAMLALKLEQVFRVEADYWLRVQSSYDLVKAREKMRTLKTVRRTAKKKLIIS